MQRVRMKIREGELDLARQQTINTERRSKRLRRRKRGGKFAPRLRLRECGQQSHCRYRWKQIKHGRIGHDKLLLIETVESSRLERKIFIDSIIENSEATANHSLRPRGWFWFCRGRTGRTSSAGHTSGGRRGGLRRRWRSFLSTENRRPGKGNARRNIKFASDVVLIFVTQSGRNSQIRVRLPFILHIDTHVRLGHARFGIASGDRELSGASAKISDLRCRQTLPLKRQGAPVLFEAADLDCATAGHDLVVGVERRAHAARESIRSAKIGGRDASDADVANAFANFDEVLTRLP